MQVGERELIEEVLRLVLDPLFKYNPFFTLYYNPFSSQPSPEIPRNPYFNYLHQISLLLDTIPRRRVRMLIGDEVGLGKTIEAIRITKYLATIGEARKILIIAPRQLIRQWLHHEIRDLMYSPELTRLLSRKNIESIIQEFSLGKRDKIILLAPLDLVKMGSTDKHTHGSYKPYYDFVYNIDWDLIIIDEAHHLSFMKSRSPLRTKRLAPICRRVKHLILLSATPSRGTHRDMLGRISLLLPELDDVIKKLEKNEVIRRQFYGCVSDYIVYRRMKEHVNMLEGEQVFTKLTSFLALVKLGRERELYENLGKFVTKILKSMDPNTPTILKIIILKRALSSPYAFLKTFTKVVESRALRTGRLGLSDYIVESMPDTVIEETLSRTLESIPNELVNEALDLLSKFSVLYHEGDLSFKALAHLLSLVISNSNDVPRELLGDYIVFSEYRDTVDYLYSKLEEFFENKGFRRDNYTKSLILKGALKSYHERRYTERGRLKHEALLNSSISILVKDDMWLFLGRISSQNQEIVHLIPDVVDVIDRYVRGRVLKVLISTDVASEGLNIQQFNIVVNYDVPWSPVKREQRIGRVYRLRQRRNCSVVDFVRETTAEYTFYTKLILKLLNILEQRLLTKPIEGVLELYVTKRGVAEEEYLSLSEKTIGEVLINIYERYYGESKPIEDTLMEAYRRLLDELRVYRDLTEELTLRSPWIENLKYYIEDFTGCSSHEEFAGIISKALEVFFNKSIADPARALRELYEELFYRRQKTQLPQALIVYGSDFEEGYLGVIDYVIDGEVRYSAPVIILKVNGEWRTFYGMKVLEWLIRNWSSGRLKPIGTQEIFIGLNTNEFYSKVKLIANRLNQNIYERLGEKERQLSSILGNPPRDVAELKPIIRDSVVRLIRYQSLDEYEAFRKTLPIDIRRWMEEVSINHVAELFMSHGCEVVEKNIGVLKPYDLLVYCPYNSSQKYLYIEVKSHLKHVLVAELSEAETELAESHPSEYIICNVMGLENPDKSAWTTVCGLYAELPKTIITTTKEEKRARLFFSIT
jgi:superfamily II DNA or RNA helicase